MLSTSVCELIAVQVSSSVFKTKGKGVDRCLYATEHSKAASPFKSVKSLVDKITQNYSQYRVASEVLCLTSSFMNFGFPLIC